MSHRREQHRHPTLKTAFLGVCLTFACLLQSAKASTPEHVSTPPGSSLRFRHIRIEDGLAQSSVQAIVQDAQGYLWFGTQDGLQRYDGYEFLTFRHDPADPTSLSDNTVNALALAQDGTLWVGTSVGGLDRFDPGTRRFTHFSNDPKDPASLSDQRVSALYIDRQQRLWVGTSAGLDLFEGHGFQHYRIPQTPAGAHQVSSLYEDAAGRLWVGSDHGVYRLEGDHLSSFVASGAMSDDQRGLFTASPIHAIAEVGGMLWIASGRGIAVLDGHGGLRHFYEHSTSTDSLSNDHALSLLPDGSGAAWVGTYGGGMSRFESEAAGFTAYQHDATDPGSLGSDQIDVLYQDRSGLIWIGTDDAGADVYNPRTRAFGYYRHKQGDRNSLASNVVWSLYKDKAGDVWVGTDHGLTRMDATRRHYRQYHMGQRPASRVDDDQVNDVYGERDGSLWTGTDYGIYRYLPARETFQRYTLISAHDDPAGDIVTYMLEDSRGRLWVGTNGGLAKIDTAKGTVRRYRHEAARSDSLPSDAVISLCETSDQRLWVGTSDGLASFDGDEDSFQIYRNDPNNLSSISYNNIQSCRADAGGGLWVGTADGLDHIKAGQQDFKRYFITDGLPNDTIYAILPEVSGAIWISTDVGLSRFDSKTGAFRNYVKSDGLQSDEFNGGAAFEAPDGELLFGGVEGMNAFYPAHIGRDPLPPKVAITRFLRQNLEVPLADAAGPVSAVQVQYRQNVLAFEFTAFDYAEPELNRFSYRLDGFDSDWHELQGRHTATYTNLDPGKYLLRVRGANSDGVWSKDEATLAIEVLPPSWRTGWAYLLYVAAGFVVLMVGLGLFKRILEREHHLSDEQRRRRWAESLHDLIHRVTAQHDDRAIAEQLIDALTNFIDYEHALFYVEGDGGLVLLASRGIGPSEQAYLEHWPRQQPRIVARLRQAQRALFLTPEDAATLASGGKPGRHHYLAVPLHSGNGAFRLLLVGRPNKPLNEQQMAVASAMAKQVNMALDNARLIQDLEDLATTDGLTRLYNRRHFMERAESEFERSRRYRRELSVFLIDADHFKAINDSLGHEAGDRALRMLAAACRQGLRHLDVIGRYGGEELVVLLPETSAAVAYEAAERLRYTVEQLRIPALEGEVRLTVSIGVATAGPDTETVAALINQADRALYEAKRSGRNRVMAS
ncbi:MAG TPA: diguanylate cyclase, partial [Gammaproteobacteria bacterium]